MSLISKWIVEVLCAVILSIVADFILPSGKTRSLVKSVCAVLTIFVMITPLVSGGKIDFNAYFSEFTIDKNFVDARKDDIIDGTARNIESSLRASGFEGVKVKIDGEFEGGELKIEGISVDLKNLVLTNGNDNINKYNNIFAIISSVVKVDRDRVVFYE